MWTSTSRESRLLYPKLEIHNSRPLSIHLIAPPSLPPSPLLRHSTTLYVVPVMEANELPLSNNYPTLSNIALQLLEMGHVLGQLLPVHPSSPSFVRSECIKVWKLSGSVNWFHGVRTRRLSDFYSRFEITLYFSCLLAHLHRTYPHSAWTSSPISRRGKRKNRKNRKRLEGIGNQLKCKRTRNDQHDWCVQSRRAEKKEGQVF